MAALVVGGEGVKLGAGIEGNEENGGKLWPAEDEQHRNEIKTNEGEMEKDWRKRERRRKKRRAKKLTSGFFGSMRIPLTDHPLRIVLKMPLQLDNNGLREGLGKNLREEGDIKMELPGRWIIVRKWGYFGRGWE